MTRAQAVHYARHGVLVVGAVGWCLLFGAAATWLLGRAGVELWHALKRAAV